VSPNSLSYLLTFGFLALFVTGCGGDTSKPSNSASPSPSTSAAASAAPVASASAAPSFTQPVVAGTDPNASPAPEVAVKSESMAASLLPASDSDAIVRNTNKGRTDPFANVVFQTVVESKTTPSGFNKAAGSANNSSGSISRNNISSSSTGTSNSPRVGSGLGLASAAANAGKGSATASTVAVKPRSIPSGALDSTPKPRSIASNGSKQSPLVPVDPSQTALRNLPQPSVSVAPAPRPVYASNIQVSGVAQVNGQTQVIIKLPNESFSRYITVGERVMDGKVLVKRVENPNSIAPTVVLEEVGMEVPRKVGEKVVAPAADAPR
jgi:hypothetical protein